MRKPFALFVALALLLGACGQVTPPPAPQPSLGAPTQPPVTGPNAATDTAQPGVTETPSLTPEPTSTLSPTETSVPVILGPDNFPAGVDALTGLKVSDPALLNRRPIAIKVNINPRYTRPPWGLSFADIVYNYYHNGGASRFHAIFYGEDAEQVGPIRSGRLPDDILVRMYKSIFVYGHADPAINSHFLNGDYSNRLVVEGESIPCPSTTKAPLCRFDPNGKDYLLGSTKEISANISNRGVSNGAQNLNGMTFYAIPPAGGTAVSQIIVRFSIADYNRWTYDQASGRYLYFADSLYLDKDQPEEFEPLVDKVTNQQIGADNVVILLAPYSFVQQPPNEILDIGLTGTGKAYAFRDGQMYEATWNRPSIDSVLYLTLPDGSRYPYKPGKTWYEIVGTSSVIKPEANNGMRFNFAIP